MELVSFNISNKMKQNQKIDDIQKIINLLSESQNFV